MSTDDRGRAALGLVASMLLGLLSACPPSPPRPVDAGTCGPSCTGCCSQGVCQQGTSWMACGVRGAECRVCAGVLTCAEGQCVPGTPPSLDGGSGGAGDASVVVPVDAGPTPDGGPGTPPPVPIDAGQSVDAGHTGDAGQGGDAGAASPDAGSASPWLDPGFGDGGLAVLALPFNGSVTKLATDRLGRLLVAGHSVGGVDLVWLARFDERGRLDATFADGGLVTVAVGANPAVLDLHALASDSLWLLGSSGGFTPESRAAHLVKLQADGQRDSTFGVGGVCDLTNAYAGFDSSLAPRASGEVVFRNSWAVTRVLSDCSYDLTFGLDGIADVLLPAPYNVLVATTVSALGDGGLRVVGWTIAPGATGMVVGAMHFDGNGHGDGGFQLSRGFARTVDVDAPHVSVDERGGASWLWSDHSAGLVDALLVRTLPDGSIDPQFNYTGMVRVGFSPTGAYWDFRPHDVALLPDGKSLALISGLPRGSPGPVAVLLGRFLPDGRVDATFAPGSPFPGWALAMTSADTTGLWNGAMAPAADGGVFLSTTVTHGAGVPVDNAVMKVRGP